jgi:hypothetical protein
MPSLATVARYAAHVALPLAGGVAIYALRPTTWIKNHAPDALWGYATGAFVSLVWLGANGRARIFWMIAGLALVAGYELGQAARIVPGTFDVVDLIVSCAAFAVAVLFVQRKPAGETKP